jgi:hypothetical protein
MMENPSHSSPPGPLLSSAPPSPSVATVPDYENFAMEDNLNFDGLAEDNFFQPDTNFGSPDQPPLSDNESIDNSEEYHPIINGESSLISQAMN